MPVPRICSCRCTSAERFFARIRMPDVSRSNRCTSSRNFASGRARRNCSITPKATPEPPWTATPAGLSIISSQASSNRIGNSDEGTKASASCAFSATRMGGIRITSPSFSR
ncbi:hypothetical protein D3C86_1277940 [compost metagenome]